MVVAAERRTKNCFGVPGAVLLDVFHGLVNTVDDTHGQVQVKELGVKVGGRRAQDQVRLSFRESTRQNTRTRCLITMELHTRTDQCAREFGLQPL